MAYQHLNRLRAHAAETLTPAERLLAWHFAYSTRTRENTYSESNRRLEKTLDLDRRTLQRCLARLVDLGLFERIDRTGTHAPIYRLLVACPQGCDQLENHNTKKELLAKNYLVATNTPPLSDKNVAPYIEIYKEKKKTGLEPETFLGEMELGFIGKALEAITKPSSDHETLKASLALYPDEVAKAALEILEKAQPGSRQAYLAQIAAKTPKRLLSYVEGAKAVAYAVEKRQAAQGNPETIASGIGEQKGTIRADRNQGIKPTITRARVSEYAQEILEREFPDFCPGISMPWLFAEAANGTLTARTAYEAAKFEEILNHLAKEELTPQARTNLPFRLIFRNGFEVIADYSGWLANIQAQLRTDEEVAAYKAREKANLDLAARWEAEKGAPIRWLDFFQSPEFAEFDQKHPEPISQALAEARFLEMLNALLRMELKVAETYDDLGQPFDLWLLENYSAEDDFKEFLSNYPTSGERVLNYEKAFTAWKNLRLKGFDHETILAKAGVYWESVSENLKFAKAPENWLADYATLYSEALSAR